MSFGYDENNTGMEPIEAGTYEVYPTKYAAQNTKRTNKPMIVMNYKIRSDVQQKSQGQIIQFDNFVAGEKSQWRFNALTKATQAFKSGFDFGTPEGWAENMLGKPIRVKITIDDKGYPEVRSFLPSENAKMSEQPAIFSHKGINSAAANAQAGMNATSGDPFANNGGPIDIDESKLPF